MRQRDHPMKRNANVVLLTVGLLQIFTLIFLFYVVPFSLAGYSVLSIELSKPKVMSPPPPSPPPAPPPVPCRMPGISCFGSYVGSLSFNSGVCQHQENCVKTLNSSLVQCDCNMVCCGKVKAA